MYQALYRKWRPQTFDDVVGQDHITETLKNQVSSGRLSHAYLFVGTRGTGKTTCAKILARAVNCESPVNGNPCNECASCRGILDGSILDVVELDAASNNGVNDVRALQDEAVFSPATVQKRVYIIDEVHMLSTPAFNALLKILEEPPEHLMFILCTTELHKVLPTIISRCQRHSFKRISPSEITARLLYVADREGIDLDRDAAALLARMADGGMRDALSLLDQCSAQTRIDTDAVHVSLGLAGNRRIESLCDKLFSSASAEALELFNELWQDGKDPAGILDELGDLIRDILILKTAPAGGTELLSGNYDLSFIRRLSDRISAGALFDALNTIQNADLSGANPRRAAEMCLIAISTPAADLTPSSLDRRIARLEALLGGHAGSAVPVINDIKPVPSKADSDSVSSNTKNDPLHVIGPVETELDTGSSDDPPRMNETSEQDVQVDEADTLWGELVRQLNGKIDMSAYAFLQSKHQFSLRLGRDDLAVGVSVPFIRTMLDTPAHVSAMSQAASEILGRSIRVHFVDDSASETSGPDHQKLESLKKYSVVKFE